MVENGKSESLLELRLAGPVRLLRPDGVEVTPKGRKAQGLLALLGVSPGLKRTRAQLQDKLWSDRGQEQGGQSLRQELASLRRTLGDLNACLVTEAGWVRLDPALVRVSLEPAPEDWDLTGAPPEFCAGLDIADPQFEDWIRDQRTAFEEKLSAARAPARPTLILEPAPREPEADPRPSIAMMPLDVLADDARQDFVGSGITIDVIGRMTRYRRLDVIAHTSTLALAPLRLTPREIGRRLGVRYVAQGSLRLGRNRLRLNVDLIDAASERVHWRETYDRAFDDVFDVEAELAVALASGLMGELDHLERARVRARDPASLDAYGLYLRGLDDMLRLDRPGCDSALAFFTRAEQQERGYARALSGISRAHGFYWKYRWTDRREEAMERADDFALRAVDSDVNDAGANAALGWVALYCRNHDRSLAAYSRAMELNPSDADILAEYADALRHDGSSEAAIPIFERAIRLNPQMSDIYSKDLAGAYFNDGQYEAAIRTIDRMRRPQIANLVLTASLALAGREERARQEAAAVLAARPGFSPEAWVTMVPNRREEHTAMFLEGLKRAGL